jgi:hypothetical protein
MAGHEKPVPGTAVMKFFSTAAAVLAAFAAGLGIAVLVNPLI